MSRKTYWDTDRQFEQPSARQLKENVAGTLQKARGKGKTLHPVIVKGQRIAKSWWGSAWCENLERYADYDNRLERGRRYLRTGTVIDLQIEKGCVSAKVQGRKKIPYRVDIRISPVNEAHVQRIMQECSTHVDSLERLLKGDFPDEMKELFLGEDGLFPTPREISFGCSCPDWALMCKHVAAVLYGIAVRFDEDPLLFFQLRGLDVDRFVSVTLENSVESMLSHADVDSDRIIRNEGWEELFGVF
ncbi:MAG: hypothetical protein IKN79_02340 [Eubacterium sp.]|nr:hypothetical protein [Eubacterium sp.]